jgi:hypothetical protein
MGNMVAGVSVFTRLKAIILLLSHLKWNDMIKKNNRQNYFSQLKKNRVFPVFWEMSIFFQQEVSFLTKTISSSLHEIVFVVVCLIEALHFHYPVEQSPYNYYRSRLSIMGDTADASLPLLNKV